MIFLDPFFSSLVVSFLCSFPLSLSLYYLYFLCNLQLNEINLFLFLFLIFFIVKKTYILLVWFGYFSVSNSHIY